MEWALVCIEHFLNLLQGVSPGKEEFILPPLSTRASWDLEPAAFQPRNGVPNGSVAALLFSTTKGTDLAG